MRNAIILGIMVGMLIVFSIMVYGTITEVLLK